MTDIIIRAKDGNDLTARCLASIRAMTPPGTYRVIIVDDGSVKPQPKGDVNLAHPTSLGAVTATNTGLKAATAPYIVVLDNDTEVPEGDVDWLDRWVAALESDPQNGAVGATSGFSSGPQHVLRAPVTYTAKWENGLKENPLIITFVSFAVMLRKAAVDAVGLWDERYNPGNFEDTDYGLALRVAGWNVKVAQSVYLHHRGHQTFREDLNELLRVNNDKFIEKWGIGRLWDLGMVSDEQLLNLLKEKGRIA